MNRTVRSRLLLFILSLLLGSLLTPTAYAQITITQADLERIFDRGQYGFTSLTAAPGETARLQSVLDAVGPNGTFDFSNVQTSASFTEAEIQSRPFSAEVPSDPAFTDADHVNIVSVFSSEPTYSFSGLNGSSDAGPDGVYEYGDVTEGVSTTTYSPPLRRFPLPMTYGTAWSSGESTVTESGLFTNTYTMSFRGEVVGYGTLIVPGGGQVEALVHRLVTVEGNETVRAFEFFGVDRLLSAIVLVDENDDVLTYPTPNGTLQPASFFQIGTGKGSRAQVSSNTTGPVLEELPLGALTFTKGSDTPGSLRGYRVDFPSARNDIDDSGTPAGFPVTNVSPEGFWIVRAEGLSNFAYTICLDYSGLPGVSDPSQLAVLRREDPSTDWRPQSSTVDRGTQQVCADGLTSFSEFAIGGGPSNSLPVELSTFTGRYDANIEAVRLRWQTVSETDNAGFALERKEEEGWTEIAFVEGGGTTSAPRSYRFEDRMLPFTAESLTYRLRQIDLDGATTYSDALVVVLDAPQAVRLHRVFPNPIRQYATVRYELPRSAEVRVEMYDLLGRRVRSLDQTHAPAGRTEVQFDTSGLPSGTYFLQLRTGRTTQTQRVAIVR